MPDKLTKYRSYFNKLKTVIEARADFFESRADVKRERLERDLSRDTWGPNYPVVVHVRWANYACRHVVDNVISRGLAATRDDALQVRAKINSRYKEFEGSEFSTWDGGDLFECVSFYTGLMLLAYALDGKIDLKYLLPLRNVLEILYSDDEVPITYSGAVKGDVPVGGTAVLLLGSLLEGNSAFVLDFMKDCSPKEFEAFRTANPDYQLLKIAYYAARAQSGIASEEDILNLRVLDAGLVAYWMQEKMDHSAGYCLLEDGYVVFYRAVLSILQGNNPTMEEVAAGFRPRAILAQFEEVEKLVKGSK